MESFSFDTWFAVRYVHVASIALLAGGAFASMALCVSAGAAGPSRGSFLAVTMYERAFWLIAGVTAATGISNLGLKGDGLLGPETNWGTALLVKLSAVLFLLALSVVRSDFVLRCGTRPDATCDRERTALMTLYGVTLAVLLGAMWAGLGLAHGRY
jgi:hypothetical protein